MSENFSCPGCGAACPLTEATAESTIVCKACGKEWALPATKPAAKSRPAARGAPANKSRLVDHASHAPKSAFPLIPVLLGAAALVGVIAFLASGGDEEPTPTPEVVKPVVKQEDPAEGAKKEIARIAAKAPQTSAAACWAAQLELASLAENWQKAGKDALVVALLNTESARLLSETERLDSGFEPLHLARGDERYDNSLQTYASAAWLDSTEQAKAGELHNELATAAAEAGGWITKTRAVRWRAYEKEHAGAKAAWDKFEASGFYGRALTLSKEISGDLEDRFRKAEERKKKDGTSGTATLPPWPGVMMVTNPEIAPFVFFVQKDDSWFPLRVAASRSRQLKSLEDIIRKEFGEILKLKDLEDPIPVLLFRNYAMYRRYSGQEDGPGGAYAHFEPMTGRLAVHDDCDHTTIMHEGTHQLMWAWTERKGPLSVMDLMGRSYWFQEGIAEWYGGAARTTAPDGQSTYEIGRIHGGRLDSIRRSQTNESKNQLFTIRELINTRYADKPTIEGGVRTPEGNFIEPPRVMQLYAQGWFLIYFMNRFNVDEKGLVHPDQPGRYQARWQKYVQAELEGRTGEAEFMKILGFSESDLARVEQEFWRFYEYVQYKRTMEQVVDKDLVPWQKAKNARGELFGTEEDDLLPAWDKVKDSAPTPRKR